MRGPMRMREVCGNCKNTYRDGDKYCRYCGAPLGTPDYIKEDFACIYGPEPKERVHKCENCGYEWETCLMVDHEEYCPVCGGPAPVEETRSLRGRLNEL